MQAEPRSISIPDHEMLRVIGKGAYGKVWLARNVMGQFRAIKIIRRSQFESDRPFEREYEGIRRFEPISRTHESQLDVLHIGRTDDCFYYVMELADDTRSGQTIDQEHYSQRTLRSEILEHGRLEYDQCLEIALALATALEHLHSHGLVHRDIKPSNVVFVNARPKLADIGLVAQTDATATMVGTPGYFPPEGTGQPAADIFSLGKVLYEISTGLDRGEFPELPTGQHERPDRAEFAELNEVITRACEPDPENRYAIAADLKAELIGLQAGKSLVRQRELERRFARIKKLSLVSAACLLFALLVAGYQKKTTNALAAQRDELRRTSTALRHSVYVSDMITAQRALEENRFDHFNELIEKHRPDGTNDFRNWEWFHLAAKTKGVQEHTIEADYSVNAVAWAPNGTRFVSGGSGEAVVWDLESRQATARVDVEGRVLSAVVSPNGRTAAALVAGDEAGRGLVFDLGSGAILDSFELPAMDKFFSPASVAYSPSGRYVYVGDSRGKLSVRDHAARRFVTHFETVDEQGISAMRTDAARSLLATAGDSAVHIWKIGESEFEFSLEREFINESPWLPMALAFSPTAEILAIGGEVRTLDESSDRTGRLRVRNFARNANTPLRTLQMDHWISGLDFSHDGSTLYGAGANSWIHAWSTDNWQLLGKQRGHTDEIWGMALSPDGRHIVSGSDDRTIRIWDAKKTRRSTSSVVPIVEGFVDWCPFADRSRFAVAHADGSTTVWNADTLQQEVRFELPHLWMTGPGILRSMSFNSADRLFAFENPTSKEPLIEVWSYEHEYRVATLKGSDPHFFPSSNRLVVTDANQSDLSIYRFSSHDGTDNKNVEFHPEARTSFAAGKMVSIESIADDGSKIAIGLRPVRTGSLVAQGVNPDSVYLWSYQERAMSNQLVAVTDLQTFGWFELSPDGSQAASLETNGKLAWSSLEEHSPPSFGYAGRYVKGSKLGVYSPDGSRVAFATGDRRLWILDTISHQRVVQFRGAWNNHNRNLLWSANGQNILIFNGEGVLFALQAPEWSPFYTASYR